MHYNKRLALLAALLLLLSSFSLPCFAWSTEDYANIIPSGQGIRFSAVCPTAQDVKNAALVGADFFNIAPELLHNALTAIDSAKASVAEKTTSGSMDGKHADALLKKIESAKLLIDVTSADQADKTYEAAKAEGALGRLCLRFRTNAKVAAQWQESKKPHVDVIGFYSGNIIFSAILRTKAYAAIEQMTYMQLLTKNPYGVVLNITYIQSFRHFKTRGMFSFRDVSLSAGRADCSQSWDDLIDRGYSAIETAYPEDFAEYLAANTAERRKLFDCVEAVKGKETSNCLSNRIREYEKALTEAQTLLKDDSVSTNALSQTRVRLDTAAKNLTAGDSVRVKGDWAVTLPRICAAVFGIALVVGMQVFFRSRWTDVSNKKKKNK